MMAEEGAQGSRERTVPDTWWVTVGTQPAILRDDTTGIDSERRTTTNSGHILYQSFDICSQEGRIRELGLPYSESAVTAAGALSAASVECGKVPRGRGVGDDDSARQGTTQLSLLFGFWLDSINEK